MAAYSWRFGVSFSKGNIAAQLKVSRGPSFYNLRDVVDKLVARGSAQGATSFVLDLRKPPGLDTTSLETALRQYIVDNYGSTVTLAVQEYELALP